MHPIEQLKADAREHRDAAIRKARAEYRKTIAEIQVIARRIDAPRRTYKYACGGYSSTTYAEMILAELGALTILELTVEAQRRGFRPESPPRRAMNLLRTSMKNHPDRFVKIGERWSTARSA